VGVFNSHILSNGYFLHELTFSTLNDIIGFTHFKKRRAAQYFLTDQEEEYDDDEDNNNNNNHHHHSILGKSGGDLKKSCGQAGNNKRLRISEDPEDEEEDEGREHLSPTILFGNLLPKNLECLRRKVSGVSLATGREGGLRVTGTTERFHGGRGSCGSTTSSVATEVDSCSAQSSPVSLVPSPRGLVPWAPYSMFFANFPLPGGGTGASVGGTTAGGCGSGRFGGANNNNNNKVEIFKQQQQRVKVEDHEEDDEEEEGPINYSTSGRESVYGSSGDLRSFEMSSIRRRKMGGTGEIRGSSHHGSSRDSLGNRISLSCDEDEDSGETHFCIHSRLDPTKS